MGYTKKRRTEGEAGPATALNDMVWLRQVFLHASAARGVDAPLQVLHRAKSELLRTRVIAKPAQRSRRLLPGEEAKLLEHFASRDGRASIPMRDIMQFALLTARRQEETCRLRWDDVDFEKGMAWLDDVKHPRMKKGNRRCFRVLKAAADIIKSQSREEGRNSSSPTTTDQSEPHSRVLAMSLVSRIFTSTTCAMRRRAGFSRRDTAFRRLPSSHCMKAGPR